MSFSLKHFAVATLLCVTSSLCLSVKLPVNSQDQTALTNPIELEGRELKDAIAFSFRIMRFEEERAHDSRPIDPLHRLKHHFSRLAALEGSSPTRMELEDFGHSRSLVLDFPDPRGQADGNPRAVPLTEIYLQFPTSKQLLGKHENKHAIASAQGHLAMLAFLLRNNLMPGPVRIHISNEGRSKEQIQDQLLSLDPFAPRQNHLVVELKDGSQFVNADSETVEHDALAKRVLAFIVMIEKLQQPDFHIFSEGFRGQTRISLALKVRFIKLVSRWLETSESDLIDGFSLDRIHEFLGDFGVFLEERKERAFQPSLSERAAVGAAAGVAAGVLMSELALQPTFKWALVGGSPLLGGGTGVLLVPPFKICRSALRLVDAQLHKVEHSGFPFIARRISVRGAVPSF